MGTPRLLLVHSPSPELKDLVQILRSFSSVEVAPSLSAVAENASYDLLLVNFDGLVPDEHSRLIRLRSQGKQVALLSVNTCNGSLAKLLDARVLTNLIGRGERCLNTELLVTASKLLSNDIFGIEKYFAWGVRPNVFRLTLSSEAKRLLAEAKGYARSLGVHPHLIDLFCNVVDELVSNAFFNAPVDRLGQRRYAHLDRTTEVALDPGEEIEARFLSDGERLGVSITDPFGSLSSEQVFDHLARCFRMGSDQIERKSGGAGLGLYSTFNSVSHLALDISPEKRTEVIGLIDIRGSYRDFRRSGRSFNLFVESTPERAPTPSSP